MDRMPGYDIVASLEPDIPPLWAHLFSVTQEHAIAWVVECLGIRADGAMATTLSAVKNIVAFAPLRRRHRRIATMWHLAIYYSDSQALVFNYPEATLLSASSPLPFEYTHIARILGCFRLGWSTGETIWPTFVADYRSRLHAVNSGDALFERITPFYDHLTGDLDCWVDNSFDAIYTLLHEVNAFKYYCNGGFGVWLEKRFCEQLR